MSERVPASPFSRRTFAWVVVLVLVGSGGWWWTTDRSAPPQAAMPRGGPGGMVPPVPVKIDPARLQDLDIYLRGLGTVTAFATVTVRSRVQGELVNVHFKEGDRVKAGDLLAQIDPRSFQVALDQAKGTLAQDVAQLDNAKLDLKRYQTLRQQKSIAEQLVDTQGALVRKFEGLIQTDQAAVDNAQLQLGFTRITAPIPGRLGLRQVDVGNLLVANDPQGLVVITQTQPIVAVFTLPEGDLPAVREPLAAGQVLRVDAYDRSDARRLAQGVLLTVDNQIDVGTGTFKLKAQFTNDDDALFPNQFVNIRILVRTLKDVLTVSPAAVQQGSQGVFVYVLLDDNTAAVRVIKIGARTGDRVVVSEGLVAGDRVVLEGTDRLRAGAKVRVISDAAASQPTEGVNSRPNQSANPPETSSARPRRP